jgi:hypothetical protein
MLVSNVFVAKLESEVHSAYKYINISSSKATHIRPPACPLNNLTDTKSNSMEHKNNWKYNKSAYSDQSKM